MKTFIKASLIGLLVTLLISTGVLAAYAAAITVTESSSNSYNMLPVSATMDNSDLASGYYITGTGLDTRVLSAGTPLPHMLASDRTLFALPISADTQYQLTYSTGNTALDNFYIIPGYDGYITVSDAEALELGNNSEIELKGYIDTSSGADKNLVYKEDGIQIYVSDTSEITAVVTNDSELVPMGVGDYTVIDSVYGAATHWEAVDDPPNDPDDSTTRVYTDSDGYQKDAYNLEDLSIPATATINSVTIHFRFRVTSGTWNCFAQPYLRLGASETSGTPEVESSAVWTDISEVLARPGGGAWTPADINNLQVAIGLKSESSVANLTQIYVAVNWTLTVTAVNVTSGLRIVKVTADGTDLEISIDGATEGDWYDSETLGDTSVADNSNNWTLMQTNVMPYMEYYKHTVSSTLIAYYQPNTIISGTALPDRQVDSGTADSGTTTTLRDDALTQADNYWNNVILEILTTTDGLAPQGETATITDFIAADDELQFAALTVAVEVGDTYELRNDGAITWGSNPTGIAATVGALLPEAPSAADVTADAEAPSFVPETSDESWFETGTEGEGFPFYGLFKGLLDSYKDLGGADISMPYFWKIVAGLAGLLFGTFLLLTTRSLLIGAAAYIIGFIVPATMGVLDWWMVIIYIMGAIPLCILSTKWHAV